MAAFHLVQVFSGWRFLLPLTLYSCLHFFLSQLSKPFVLCFFLGESIPTSDEHMVLCPSFSTFFHDTPSSPQPVSTAHFSVVFSFCLQRIVETHLAHVGPVRFFTFINYHRSQLPIAEGLFAALVVTTKQQLLRNAYRARYENPLFHFFLLRALCSSHVILRFFCFHTLLCQVLLFLF